ncbi:polysaccharide biosynthesis protein [Sediminicola luteus]|uniref:polysaccharide biosynthesis protein n=1 Tax=Sediminicola luteus TaxID=319238 RepID=UPI00155198BB|nr:polysaccharide biosynthesis protein [Sediminicola luteus]
MANILTIVLVVINGKLVMEQDFMVPLSIIIVHSILSFSALVISRLIYKKIMLRIKRDMSNGIQTLLVHDIPMKEMNALHGDLLEKLLMKGYRVTGEFGLDEYIAKNDTVAQKSDAREEEKNVLFLSLKNENPKLWDVVSTSFNLGYSLSLILLDKTTLKRNDDFNFRVEKLDINHLFPAQIGFDAREMDKMRKYYEAETIFITGAGGAIASAYVRVLAELNVKLRLVLVDNSEASLNNVVNTVGRMPLIEVVSVLLDVKNKRRLKELVGKYRPAIILHAAGNSTSEFLEDDFEKAIQENVMATKSLADIAKENKVKEFIFCSTVHAKMPRNTLDVSKRLAEMYLHCLNEPGNLTKFTSFRINDVYDSYGSNLIKIQKALTLKKDLELIGSNNQVKFIGKDDVAKLMLRLLIGDSSGYHAGGIFKSPIGIEVGLNRLVELFGAGKLALEKKQTSALPHSKRILMDLKPTGFSGYSRLFEACEDGMEEKKEYVIQKIESLCLSVLFNEKELGPVFDLIHEFGSGPWEKLYKLHNNNKEHKVLKLQSK